MRPGHFLAMVALLVALSIGLGVAAVALSVQYNKGQAAETANTCRKVNVVQAEIRSTIARQKKALPTNPYYRTHYKELAPALAEIDRELKVFNPLKC